MDVRQLRLFLDSSVSPDVTRRHPSLTEDTAHEEPSVATRRVLLTAHDRHRSLAGETLELLEPP